MLTKEQWKQIETALSFDFGRAELRCDGFLVHADVQYAGPLKQVIRVYVDGVIKGAWYRGENDEPKKFWREQKQYLYRKNQRDAWLKESKRRRFSPEHRQWCAANAEASISTWTPEWNTPSSFCRHLRKTCTSMEIVKLGWSY